MNDEQMVFRLRKKIFNEWRVKDLTWQEVKEKYGFSKAWFYKFRKRYLRYGEEGLRDKVRNVSYRPHALRLEHRLKILDYVYDNPTHGVDRIALNIAVKISAKAIWSFLKKENLNTRIKRMLWVESQGKPVLSEKQRSYLSAQKNHIESKRPGELISVDTFMVRVKSLGKIWQWTACDTYSSFGWAKVYRRKTADQTIDFLENHILKNVPEGKIKRILTDQGTEFYSARQRVTVWQLQDLCQEYNIKHTVTKVAHPWTNGYVERLNQTIWQEFYLCRLTHPFHSLEQLQKELDQFMRDYNFSRRHTGYKLKGLGLQYPAHAFFDIRESTKLVEIAI